MLSSRLDYCNSLSSGLPQRILRQLLPIQKPAATILTKIKKTEHIVSQVSSLAPSVSEDIV